MSNKAKFKQLQRIVIHTKYHKKCAYCGDSIELKEMQVDHVIPKHCFVTTIANKIRVPKFLKHLTVDDVNHIDNLNPSCRVCNKWKDVFDIELFRTELQDQIKRLNNYSSNYRIAKKYRLIEEKSKPIVFWFETFNDQDTLI